MKKKIEPFNSTAPTKPGVYYWSEYKCNVEIIKLGKFLYVTPPINGGVEIKVTSRIAGKFSEPK